ncbi:glucans biosynthesis glucosyltransferase MdoH [Hansschlegelia quercus]|uniref:Glucans biosynthesis glucosyltransferase H n=2 Tax=Hansschlegelia quercus TaxID=2528245 RepID=A0A4Q9GD34_9HYPH|nr:glucans biosynthesis glucosyltransferase MdoH [Hansschlegelia quercus]TBN48027.1 glucans biosynthesis glucosyltransferase MdoH [Hansschlegelia quercus]
MDPVNDQTAAPPVSTPAAMPPERPIAMPPQPLKTWSRGDERSRIRPEAWKTPWGSRAVVFTVSVLATGFGAREMYGVVEVGGVTVLEWALLALFLVNFAWIALAFASGIIGFFALIGRPALSRPELPEKLTTQTALVMPIYNEQPSRVFGAVQAAYDDVKRLGFADHFDCFLLSDTTDPDVWIAEERAFLELRETLGPDARVYYRHRAKNHRRKAGNIEDFVSRWGGAYDHLLIFDADSLMTGHAVIALAAAMEADPDAGIIQTLPLVINRNTLFARVQQFASRVYGPVIAAGIAVWYGRDGNYWGHNAIIRTVAFAEGAGLPDLPGKPPFGGLILSHDFVEAALIRRKGWAVYMLPQIEGSYEESPPSLIDVSQRDRRWCQGNLQHSALLGTAGLHPLSRHHFLNGIFSYLASPFWMFMLLCGIALALQSKFIRPEYFTDEFSLFPAWPRFDAERALALFGITMAILIAPKIFGLIVHLLHGPSRRAGGGTIRIVISAILEIILSSLFAPIMMLVQSGSVFQILAGGATGWNPQRRDDGSIPFADIVRRHRWHTVLGVVALGAGAAIAPSLVAWMSPTIAGLLLAIPLSWLSGHLGSGLALKRLGLMLIPEETNIPEIATAARENGRRLAAAGVDEGDALATVHADEKFFAAHERMLAIAPARKKGVIEADRVMAAAKLSEAETLDDAKAWLTTKEKTIVLQDRALLGLLARLPITPAPTAL